MLILINLILNQSKCSKIAWRKIYAKILQDRALVWYSPLQLIWILQNKKVCCELKQLNPN